jgi:hypothetical protein
MRLIAIPAIRAVAICALMQHSNEPSKMRAVFGVDDEQQLTR